MAWLRPSALTGRGTWQKGRIPGHTALTAAISWSPCHSHGVTDVPSFVPASSWPPCGWRPVQRRSGPMADQYTGGRAGGGPEAGGGLARRAPQVPRAPSGGGGVEAARAAGGQAPPPPQARTAPGWQPSHMLAAASRPRVTQLQGQAPPRPLSAGAVLVTAQLTRAPRPCDRSPAPPPPASPNLARAPPGAAHGRCTPLARSPRL